jgi:hypothetical protein
LYRVGIGNDLAALYLCEEREMLPSEFCIGKLEVWTLNGGLVVQLIHFLGNFRSAQGRRIVVRCEVPSCGEKQNQDEPRDSEAHTSHRLFEIHDRLSRIFTFVVVPDAKLVSA